jgi:hypothetical protein
MTELFYYILLAFTVMYIHASHPMLYKFPIRDNNLQPSDITIVQFDSRPLGDYWNVSARWNKHYSDIHGHHYLFLTMSSSICFNNADEKNKGNRVSLALPWCKVKAMIFADRFLDRSIKGVLFIDSDAVITVNYSMATVLAYIQQDLHWDINSHPVAFNQDGPGWSCKFSLKRGYDYCLNSGTVFWMRSPVATNILQTWWNSSRWAYGSNKFPNKWKIKVQTYLILPSRFSF